MTRVSLTLLLALGLMACESIDSIGGRADADATTGPPIDVPDADLSAEGGAPGAVDAGQAPAPMFGGFAGFPADPDFNASFDSGEASGGFAEDPDTRLSCYDGLDNDASSVADCADPVCQSLGSCCVGRGDCCAELSAGPLPTELDVSMCAGTDASACVAGLGLSFSTFGDISPFLDRGALAPGGDSTGDSGLILGEPVDLRTHSVSLDADITAAEDCSATCLESVALGFVADGAVGRVVRPLVALLSSPSRGQMRLVVGGEVVKSFPVTAPSVRWALRVEPTGRVHVGNDQPGFVEFEAPFAPVAAARLVIYGRSRNPSATGVGGARIGKLAIHTSLCDMPSAWDARRPLPLLEGGNPATSMLRAGLDAPSLVRDADTTFVALAQDGSILLATLEDSGAELTPTGATEYITPDTSLSWQARGFDDPALLRPGARPPEVYFTTRDMDGTERVGVAMLNAGVFEVAPAPALDPSDFEGLVSISQPTVAEHGSATLVVARVGDAAGSHLEAFYRTEAAGPFTRIAEGNLRTLTESGSDAADAADVGEPSLVLFDHAWHLYVSRRQGARHSIGLLASDELVSWRWVDRDAFGAGDESFDRLGARSPAALADGDAVSLLYVGLDGSEATLGQSSREANSGMVTP